MMLSGDMPPMETLIVLKNHIYLRQELAAPNIAQGKQARRRVHLHDIHRQKLYRGSSSKIIYQVNYMNCKFVSTLICFMNDLVAN